MILKRRLLFDENPLISTISEDTLQPLINGVLLCCLSNSEAQEVLKETHDGIYGIHQSGLKLKDRLRRLGYYWLTMITDAIQYARKYKAQIYADFIHQPPELLHSTFASWLFEAWGIDVIGPISPLSVRSHQFILAIIDYFTKWAEAVLLAEVKTSNVINFIKHHVIH